MGQDTGAPNRPYCGFSDEMIERLSARLHEVYQLEAHRRGDVRHADAYDDLSEATKDWDRVLARWVLTHFSPSFDLTTGIPEAHL